MTAPLAKSKFAFLWIILLFAQIALGATRFKVGEDGKVLPFKFKAVPLAQFLREYSEFSGQGMQVAGKWEDVLHGNVDLFVPRPVSREVLAELFHQVLASQNFSAVDDPSGKWNILMQRDARDAAIQFSDASHFIPSYRLQTVVFNVEQGRAEEIARIMRSYMPANSRIIPTTHSQVVITDLGYNIEKLKALMALVKSAPKPPVTDDYDWGLKKGCPTDDHTIQTLTVEKLEVKEISALSPSPTPGVRK